MMSCQGTSREQEEWAWLTRQHAGEPLGERIYIKAATQRALEQQRPLRAVLGEDPTVTAHLPSADLDHLFDPLRSLGISEPLVRRVTDGNAG